jgi:hypothetical protein
MRIAILTSLALAFSVTPALAAQEKPLADRDPSAMDVAKTPVTDLNIDKQEIPEILLAAQGQPYHLGGLSKCRRLMDEVTALDEVLGPDIDLPEEQRSRISPGRMAKTVVGSFIPFRGLIREVSGANEHDRKVRVAVQAGMVRRAFLKGVGQSKNCGYPARPASAQTIAAFVAERDAPEQSVPATAAVTSQPIVVQPVVQKAD